MLCSFCRFGGHYCVIEVMDHLNTINLKYRIMKKIMLFLVIGLFLQAPIVAEAQILKRWSKR